MPARVGIETDPYNNVTKIKNNKNIRRMQNEFNKGFTLHKESRVDKG
jgi:hypothetical protein